MNKTAMIQAGLRAAITELNPAHVLSDAEQIKPGYYVMFISDPKTETKVPLIWTRKDENKIKSAENLYDFIHQFAENAVNSLTDILKENNSE